MLHPDVAPGVTRPVTYVPYTFEAPAWNPATGKRLVWPDGRSVMLHCTVPVHGKRACVVIDPYATEV